LPSRFLRPSLSPEDVRFTGLNLTELQAEHLRLTTWLRHLFRVLGGYAAACGILTVTIATTSFRRRDRTAGIGALLAGAVSIGWMVLINFMIDSDFKWPLLTVALLWAGSMVLFWTEPRTSTEYATNAVRVERSGSPWPRPRTRG
jgi:hypothetical protein